MNNGGQNRGVVILVTGLGAEVRRGMRGKSRMKWLVVAFRKVALTTKLDTLKPPGSCGWSS